MSELTPYLCVADARAAIEWYARVLDAEVTFDPIEMPDGRIGHVELEVDGARWMMSEEFPEIDVVAPDPGRGIAVSLHLTVADVDAVAARVVDAGVTLDRGPRTARPPAGSRCSRTPSATAGSSTGPWRRPSAASPGGVIAQEAVLRRAVTYHASSPPPRRPPVPESSACDPCPPESCCRCSSSPWACSPR